MPAIKLKKAAAEHQAEKEREERERESDTPSSSPPKTKDVSFGGGSLLRGLDANILFEKRKRQIPPSEQKLLDWIEANIEKREDGHASLLGMYEYFGEACSFDGTPVVDQYMFNKRVHEKFGKFFGLKESSPYKGLVKEKSKSKPKPDPLKIKMKDIIEEAIKEAGNPEKGVRFGSLKQYIACNYPALRVDLRPGYLKIALERQVRYGFVQLVKGVGLAGFYRLPVDEEPDETDEKSADKETDKSGTEQQNGDAEDATEKVEEDGAEAKPKKKSRKKKAEQAEGEEGEKGEEGEAAEGEGEEGEAKKKKKKTKKVKRRRPRTDSYHAAPQRIEDTFALAMTYMCEPKQTSFGKIKKYIAEHYPQVDVENELKGKMESGLRKGYWEHVTGQGMAGTFQLMIDEFDPNSTDNIEDMICSAIIACNEPKQASANLLKKYVLEYHPEFKIDSRPHLFKLALERAVKKQMIIQLSGIGASGSFQMWSVFIPSPALLAGEDNYDEVDIFVVKEEAYVPRGTKSRGIVARKSPLERAAESRSKPQKRTDPSSRKAAASKASSRDKTSSRGRGRVSYVEEGDEENEEDEPAPKKARKVSKPTKAKKGKKPGKASPKKKRGKPVSRSQHAEEEEEEEEEVKEEEEEEESDKSSKASPKKKGSKPVSRSQLAEAEEDEGEEEEEEEEKPKEEEEKPKKSQKSKPVKKAESSAKSSRGRSKSRPNYADGKEESDDGDEEPKSRGRKSSGSRRSSKTVSYSEKEDVGDEEEEGKTEYTPRKSKSRGGEEETEASEPPKKKGRKRR